MELEWTQDFPFPTGSLTIPKGTVVEFCPTYKHKLRVIVGGRGLDGFIIYLDDAVTEQIKQALLNPEEMILANQARERQAAKRAAILAPVREMPAASIAEEV